MSNKDFKTGIVLSGGGTRGFAHLGVLQALEEHGIKPEIISGVSAGSIVGVFYADGKSPGEILHLFGSKKIFDYFDFTIPRTGLVKMTGFEKTLSKHLDAHTFEDLKIPLQVFAVNMNTAEYKRFDTGDLIRAVKASSSIPFLFPPTEIDGEYYCDGGVVNNFPIEFIRPKCEILIGVSVNPLGKRTSFSSLKQVAERTFQLSIRAHALDRKKQCELFIEPEGVGQYGFLDISKGNEIYELGYKAGKQALENSYFKQK